jgi:NAD(P)-dependent dehydrogenase (short-subunit alcohol dehydrogenase family)
MDLGLSGRTVVVTGGTSGVGLATVRLLLGEGAFVALCARDEARLARTRDTLSAEFGAGHLLASKCDVTRREDVAGFAALVSNWRGRCDALVNNAGGGRFSTFADTEDAIWREELELKFFSQIFPIRAFKTLLEISDAAAIVTVSSLLAYQPEPHMVCTSAARAGVQNLLKSLSREFAPKIRVNSVIFGLIESAQWQRRFEARPDKSETREQWYGALARDRDIPLGRFGTPDEAARAIAFLASPAASYVTGAQLEMSGGLSHYI